MARCPAQLHRQAQRYHTGVVGSEPFAVADADHGDVRARQCPGSQTGELHRCGLARLSRNVSIIPCPSSPGTTFLCVYAGIQGGLRHEG